MPQRKQYRVIALTLSDVGIALSLITGEIGFASAARLADQGSDLDLVLVPREPEVERGAPEGPIAKEVPR
jgi:hypothetical protein